MEVVATATIAAAAAPPLPATFTSSTTQQKQLLIIYNAISNGHTFYDRHGKKIHIVKLIMEKAKDQIAALGSQQQSHQKKQRYNPYGTTTTTNKRKYVEFIDE